MEELFICLYALYRRNMAEGKCPSILLGQIFFLMITHMRFKRAINCYCLHLYTPNDHYTIIVLQVNDRKISLPLPHNKRRQRKGGQYFKLQLYDTQCISKRFIALIWYFILGSGFIDVYWLFIINLTSINGVWKILKHYVLFM